MRVGALTLITYLWHYLVARAVYDELLRPALRGHLAAVAPIVVLVAAAVFLISRWRRRT